MTRAATKTRGRAAAEEDEIYDARTVGRDPDDVLPDFIDWDELAEDEAAVLISVIELGEMEETEYGEVEPWIGRVIVLTGEWAGEVYQDVKIFKGGIRNKCEAAGEHQHVIGRLGFYSKGEGRKKQEYVGLNGARPSDKDKAKAALAKFGRPWEHTSNGKAATNGRAKARDEDEDEERPARTTRSRRAKDEDDEDEAPARSTRSRRTAAEDDDDEPPRAARRGRARKDDDEPPARATRSRSSRAKKADVDTVEDDDVPF